MRILEQLLGARSGLSGADIFNATRISSGTLYPILYRLEALKWLKASWENIDPAKEGRPKQRFYQLTNVGTTQAKMALARYVAKTEGATAPAWSPNGGWAR